MKIKQLLSACLLFTAGNLLAQPGTFDNSFGRNGKMITDFGALDEAKSVVIQSDGKIVAAGYTYTPQSDDANFALARYNTNGTLDSAFGQNGKVVTDFNAYDEGRSAAIQNDGKIVVAGLTAATETNIAVARYNTDGSLDSTFGNAGKVITNLTEGAEANYVAIQPDGKILIAGSILADEIDFVTIRYNTNGALDSSFGTGGVVITNFYEFDSEDVAYGVVIQPDGRIVVAGYRNELDFNQAFALARYNTNGTLDNTFGEQGLVVNPITSHDFGRAVALQPDGKIIVAGYSTLDDNSVVVARFNADGTPDNTFIDDGDVVLPGAPDDRAYSIAIQPDGKIVFAGVLNVYSVNSGFFVGRTTSSGRKDTTFGKDGGVYAWGGTVANSVTLQTDGKIVAAGAYGDDFAVARFVGDEAASATFTSSSINNSTRSITPTSVRLYPNPASSVLYIQGLISSSPAIITISDMAGNIFQKEKVTGKEHAFNISRLKAGEYIVAILQNNKIVTLKFIKH